MFSSIRIRLLFSHLAVIILAMGLSGFLLLSFLQRYFLEATEESLRAQAQITAQALIPGARTTGPVVQQQAPSANQIIQQRSVQNLALQTENLAVPDQAPALGTLDLGYLSDASLQLGAQLETRIRVLDTNGTVLIDSGQSEVDADLSAEPLIAQALQGQYASRNSTVDNEAIMYVALPVLVEGELVSVVYLSQPLRDVTAVLGDLRSRWAISTIIALLGSGGAGLLLSRAITRPLRRLTVAAGGVAEGQFDTQVPVRSRDELGRLSRAFNDMTARLRAARQMQTAFVANVSHELRTPLTSIKGMVETLRDGAVDDLTVRDRFLEVVEHETNRLIRLVNDLLVLSRADSEALNLRRTSVAMGDLIQATVTKLTPQAEARDLVLHTTLDPTLPSVWADADRIAQVLVNVLDNAIKYAQPGGAITVHAKPDQDGSVIVQVRDEGIGIPADVLPHIGERFYRADKARSRAQGGSGLGVAIAQALVQAHGGQLWLESEEGVGTTVYFTLPVEDMSLGMRSR
jgi:signal transduction histidine kinase